MRKIYLENLTKKFNITEHMRETLVKRVEELEKMTEQDKIKVENSEKARIVLKKFSTKRREDAARVFEELCTSALKSVFGDRFSAKIIMSEKDTAKPKAELVIVDSVTMAESDPIHGNGGGTVDILSVALRVAVIENICDIDGPIILDEPYKHLSIDFIPQVSEFLKRLGEKTGRQIIMSTHSDFLAQAAQSVCTIN